MHCFIKYKEIVVSNIYYEILTHCNITLFVVMHYYLIWQHRISTKHGLSTSLGFGWHSSVLEIYHNNFLYNMYTDVVITK